MSELTSTLRKAAVPTSGQPKSAYTAGKRSLLSQLNDLRTAAIWQQPCLSTNVIERTTQAPVTNRTGSFGAFRSQTAPMPAMSAKHSFLPASTTDVLRDGCARGHFSF
jgi:hypothetical protein